MPTIRLKTHIQAPIERVYDLSLSVDFHQDSVGSTGERAIAGVTSGLIQLGDTVTWRAKHLGVWQTLTSKLTAYDRPTFFVDEMVNGAFQSFRHEHHYKAVEATTQLIDVFVFYAPLGPMGRLAEWLFLTAYMRRFLQQRNDHLKAVAEGDGWQRFL